MKKIAFVIIRYGAEVNGGAEAHCRMLAERLLPYYDVEVLTTTMRIFGDPSHDYPEGVQDEHGVTVRRFRPEPVDGARYREYRRRSKGVRRFRFYLARLGLLRPLADLLPRWEWGCRAERRYFEAQSGHTPAMMRYIEEHGKEYAAFLFMNYYFSQTVLGAAIVPEKTILIPLAHPDRSLYFSLQTRLFSGVRRIAFNAAAEERLCRSVFGRSMAPSAIVGAGPALAAPADWEAVRSRYGLPDDYILYLGRITPGKIGSLIPDYLAWKRRAGAPLKLVLAGGVDPAVPKPDDPDILFTGFIADAEKSALIRHAAVMVNPSPHESLSLLMLEALAEGVPALVNGAAEVMKDHCTHSGAAWWYKGSRDFRRKLQRLAADPELRRELGSRGPAYVREHYDWAVIIGKLRGMIDAVEA